MDINTSIPDSDSDSEIESEEPTGINYELDSFDGSPNGMCFKS